DTLGKMVDVFFDARSNLVTVEAAGGTAAEATRITGGVVNAFLEQQRDIVKARAEDSVKMLSHDLAESRTRLERAHVAYDAYRTEHGVSDIDAEKQLAIANLQRLKQEQQMARGQVTTLDAKIAELDSQARRAPRTMVQSGASTNPDAAQLAQLRTELA